MTRSEFYLIYYTLNYELIVEGTFDKQKELGIIELEC